MAGERLRKALKVYREMYHKGCRRDRTSVLDAFCRVTRYCPKYAIVLLNLPVDSPLVGVKRHRGFSYSVQALRGITEIWEAAGYPWSVRLKALIPLWLPWAREEESRHATRHTHIAFTAEFW